MQLRISSAYRLTRPHFVAAVRFVKFRVTIYRPLTLTLSPSGERTRSLSQFVQPQDHETDALAINGYGYAFHYYLLRRLNAVFAMGVSRPSKSALLVLFRVTICSLVIAGILVLFMIYSL